MDKAFDEVLARYLARMRDEEPAMADAQRAGFDPDKYLLAVGEEVARVLHALIVARRAKHILELGTSYGFSTLFLADAARRTGGKVVTMDVAADKQDYARRQLADAKLDGFVDFQAGNALDLLVQAEGPIEFVLLDLWKDLYVPCFEAFRSKLAPNAIVAADNMLYPEIARADAERYQAAVRADSDFQSMLLPIGSGIELSCRGRK
ncbi:MAG TPA: class I SAM-dependent methyltransferase [Allosphingosinicella sp.]|nr:class I SAM-dependent methyltransferase [Allosphingosinicella sp.]